MEVNMTVLKNKDDTAVWTDEQFAGYNPNSPPDSAARNSSFSSAFTLKKSVSSVGSLFANRLRYLCHLPQHVCHLQ